MIRRACLALAALLLWASQAGAHESRPGYLDIRELQAGRYEAVWKRPVRGERALGLSVRWPVACSDMAPGTKELVPGALIERRLIDCGAAGLVGQRIAIEGLADTLTDTLVRIAFRDGSVQTNLVKPTAPWIAVDGPRPGLAVASDYLALGTAHILGGIDHLLFVLGLMLIVGGLRQLVKTITAFTVAHSITLSLAARGFVAVPQRPVEAVIALSIVFLASEIVRARRGSPSLAARAPWLVAFAFGLLHGFGFAGALAGIGLPQADIPLALLSFNLGVEVGQIAFVAAVLALVRLGRRAIAAPPRWLPDAAAYAIGSAAAFWLIERTAALG